MILLNNAGGSAADPILKGLGLEWVIAPTSMDVSTLEDAWIDPAAGIPGTNSVKASLSPSANTIILGTNGSYDHSTQRLTVASTSGLSAGDYVYLSHASITAGVYRIASIPQAGVVTLENNPFTANQSGVVYQVAWRYAGVAGTAPIGSSAAGQQNYFKVRGQDALSTSGQLEDSAFVRDAPSGSAYVAIDGKAFTGQTTSDSTPSFNLLPAWANRGGVTHVEIANHSVQGVATIRFSDGSITEKTLASVLTNGLQLQGGDGAKYARLLFKSQAGAAVTLGVDVDITLDTAGPSFAFSFAGR